MRHYEIVFMVHPDQSEQVPGMIERYTIILKQQDTRHEIQAKKKAARRAAFFKYVSDYASAMMITLIEVITSE